MKAFKVMMLVLLAIPFTNSFASDKSDKQAEIDRIVNEVTGSNSNGDSGDEYIKTISNSVTEHRCSKYSEVAKQMMTARQSGIPYSKLSSACKSHGEDVAEVCKSAYETPIVKSGDERTLTIVKFSLEKYRSCLAEHKI